MARRLSFRRKKKLRGVRRRLQDVIEMPHRHGSSFPEPNRWGYLDFKLPVDQALVEGSHVRLTHLKQCAQTLLDLCMSLKERVPHGASSPKVIASIYEPEMFSSRVTIFWDPEYYRKFFLHDEPNHNWTRLDSENSLVKRWQLNDHGLAEMCIHEKMVDGEFSREGKIWFLGDIPG